MRFKAKLAAEQVSLLYCLIGSVTRLIGTNSEPSSVTRTGGTLLMGGSILYLDSHVIRITTKGKGDGEGVSFISEISSAGGIFLEHKIESAAENSAIALEIDLVQLRMAIQSIVSNHDAFRHGEVCATPLQYMHTVLKLAKRDNIPCLCVDAHGNGLVAVHHSIPVRIMRVEESYQHLPPKVNAPDVQLELPNVSDRPLRTIAERLKAVCSNVYVCASVSGELTLRTDTEGFSTRVFLGKLTPRLEECRQGAKDACCLKIDSKKFLSCLQWQQCAMISNVSNALFCFIENEMLVMHVTLSPHDLGFLTYYVPVHFVSEEDVTNL